MDSAEGGKTSTPKNRRLKEAEDKALEPLPLNSPSPSSPPVKKARTRTPKKTAPPTTAVPEAAAALGAPGEDAVVETASAAPAVVQNGSQSAAAEAAVAVAPPKAKRVPKPLVPVGPVYHEGLRPAPCVDPAHRLVSWNVAGLRALLKKNPNALKELVEAEKADVLCLQEHKLQTAIEDVLRACPQGWHATWSFSQARKGYSGTATLCRQKPLSSRVGIGIPEHDDEGRVVTVELPDLWLVNCYVPNAGDGLKRLDYRVGSWDKAFASYLQQLEAQGKPVVLTGDLNCAHLEIDIHDPKRNLRSAGFTQEERDSFSTGLLGEVGLVDTFRAQHPGVVGFTYYGYRSNARATGKGWRLDYFLVSSSLGNQVHDSFILKEAQGSDHVPIGLVLKKDAVA